MEKHVPVIEVEGNKVTVRVGAVEHPMLPEHYIEDVYKRQVDVMMTADFTEMAMVVFSAEPLPVPMTMVPFTILRRNIITGYWSLLR